MGRQKARLVSRMVEESEMRSRDSRDRNIGFSSRSFCCSTIRVRRFPGHTNIIHSNIMLFLVNVKSKLQYCSIKYAGMLNVEVSRI